MMSATLVFAQASTAGWVETLAPGVAGLTTVFALAVGYLLYRVAHLEVLAPFRRYIVAGLIVTWGFALVEVVFALSYALTSSGAVVGLCLLAAVILTNLSWLRHVTAGLVLAFERRLEVGDTVQVEGVQGEIESFGLRSVRVRAADGRFHDLPNQQLVDQTVVDLAEEGDSMCELTVSVPEGVTVDGARVAARRAAGLSPYASPRHRPEVLVASASDRDVELKVRGYAYQSGRRDAFRSDVTERIFEAFDAAGGDVGELSSSSVTGGPVA